MLIWFTGLFPAVTNHIRYHVLFKKLRPGFSNH